MFSGYSVTHLYTVFLDHKPLSIHLEGLPIRNQRPWRFEQVWLNDEACRTTVEAAWESPFFSSNLMLVVEANVNNYQWYLKEWSRVSFGNISRTLAEKKKQIKVTEGEAVRSGNGDQLHVLKAELRELLIKEEKL